VEEERKKKRKEEGEEHAGSPVRRSDYCWCSVFNGVTERWWERRKERNGVPGSRMQKD
jgi:hypothetical protein